MKKLRHLAEYAVLRAAIAFVELLSLRRATQLASGLADLAFFLGRKRRRIARDNILAAGIRPNSKQADILVRAVYRHFAVMAIESTKAARLITEHNWREHVTVSFSPEVKAVFDDPAQPVILATGHIGNWEAAALVMAFLRPIMGIARPMNNPYVERLLATRTARRGFQTVPKHGGGMERFRDALKAGFMLFFMIDQHARRHGKMVPFLGRPASTHYGFALLHLMTHVPIYFGYCIRTGPLQYEFHASGPYRCEPTGNREQDIARILLEMNHALESAIRRNPEQYMWFHRRWKQTAAAPAGDPLRTEPQSTAAIPGRG